MQRKDHWERVYSTKDEQDVSWFEALPALSLRMLEDSGLTRETCVLDVGGGDSRLGEAAKVPVWIEADVTVDWTLKPMDIWHDRAVFHFLTTSEDQTRYLQHLRAVLNVQGTAIIATFAPDGPETCSGLPVARYSPEALRQLLGSGFSLADSQRHIHHTPWGSTQAFQYSRFVRLH